MSNRSTTKAAFRIVKDLAIHNAAFKHWRRNLDFRFFTKLTKHCVLDTFLWIHEAARESPKAFTWSSLSFNQKNATALNNNRVASQERRFVRSSCPRLLVRLDEFPFFFKHLKFLLFLEFLQILVHTLRHDRRQIPNVRLKVQLANVSSVYDFIHHVINKLPLWEHAKIERRRILFVTD